MRENIKAKIIMSGIPGRGFGGDGESKSVIPEKLGKSWFSATEENSSQRRAPSPSFSPFSSPFKTNFTSG